MCLKNGSLGLQIVRASSRKDTKKYGISHIIITKYPVSNRRKVLKKRQARLTKVARVRPKFKEMNANSKKWELG